MLVHLLCVTIFAVLFHFLILSLSLVDVILGFLQLFQCISFMYALLIVLECQYLLNFDSHSFFPMQLILHLNDRILNSVIF